MSRCALTLLVQPTLTLWASRLEPRCSLQDLPQLGIVLGLCRGVTKHAVEVKFDTGDSSKHGPNNPLKTGTSTRQAEAA